MIERCALFPDQFASMLGSKTENAHSRKTHQRVLAFEIQPQCEK